MRGKFPDPRRERALEARGERHAIGVQALPGQPVRAEGHRQFHQREQITRRGLEQRVPDCGRKARGKCVQQRTCRRIVKRPDHKLREPGRLKGVIDAVPDGKHQHYRLEMHPAGHEGQHIAGRAVEPMRVVGNEQQWSGLRGPR